MPRLLSVRTLALTLAPSAADDWPQFRGPGGVGVAAGATPPAEWGPDKNLAWKVRIPGQGWAQPVVVGDTVYVATAVSPGQPRPKNMMAGVVDPSTRAAPKLGDAVYSWELHALDRKTGETRWKTVAATGKPQQPTHASNTYATETPCADAERVYTFFGAAGVVAAYTHAGDLAWKVEVGVHPHSNGFGTGSSPALAGGRLFAQSYAEDAASLLALDAKTGEPLWKAERPKGSAWGTPLVWTNSLRTEVVACGNGSVIAYDPATGKELWKMGGIDTSFSSSAAADGDPLVFGTSSPGSSNPLYAVKAGASGDVTLKKGQTKNDWVLWSRTKSGPGMASPVVTGGRVYIPGSGTLACFDLKTGEPKFNERLPKAKGMITANPFLAGGKLYLTDEAGLTVAVPAGGEFDVAASNKLGEPNEVFWASPAVAGGDLFLRGTDYLYCVRAR